jgi:rubrerythrin
VNAELSTIASELYLVAAWQDRPGGMLEVEALAARIHAAAYADQESSIAAVRALHVPSRYSTWACEECTHGCGTGDVELPCPTLRALDGESES